MPTISRTRVPRNLAPLPANNDEFPDDRATKRRKLDYGLLKQQSIQGYFGQYVNPPVKTQQINGVVHDPPTPSPPPPTNGTSLYDEIASIVSKTKQETAEDPKKDKRTLRSQDDRPRFRSDLSTYFPNYEDIMFDTKPAETELLDLNTKIYMTDEAKTTSPQKSKSMPSRARVEDEPAALPPGVKRIDLSSFGVKLPDNMEDPLTDDTFFVSHRRAERKEKSMRNLEREHAMHEKAQLERLLEGLLGHDWLKVLGITGVTESEAKKYEPKRQYFIEEVRILVDKFKQWRDEERRQRLERDAQLAAAREAEQDDEDDVTEISTSNTPSTDLNASASRQLQQETASALRIQQKLKQAHWPPPIPDRPPSPITSFYSARHLRESALKHARISRNQLAFGLPLPEVEEQDFYLPEDILSEDVLRASARERRRKKRETVANSAGDQA